MIGPGSDNNQKMQKMPNMQEKQNTQNMQNQTNSAKPNKSNQNKCCRLLSGVGGLAHGSTWGHCRPKLSEEERKKEAKKLMLQDMYKNHKLRRQTRNTFHQNFTYITIYTSMFPHKSVSAKQVVQLQATQK